MRILVYDGHPFENGETGRQARLLTKALVKAGHSVVLAYHEDGAGLDTSLSLRLEERSLALSGEEEAREEEPAGACTVYMLTPEDSCSEEQVDEDGRPLELLDRLDEGMPERYPRFDLAGFIKASGESIAALVQRFQPEVVHVCNAVVMPYIVRQVVEECGTPYFVSVSGETDYLWDSVGSGLHEYIFEGLEGAEGIFFSGDEERTRLISVLEGIEAREGVPPAAGALGEGHPAGGLARIRERSFLVPEAVDTELFRPATEPFEQAAAGLIDAVEARCADVRVGDFRGRALEEKDPGNALEWLGDEVARINSLHPELLVDRRFSRRLDMLARQGFPFLLFIGELVESSGIQLLLPALPLVAMEYPEVRLVVCGTGELRGLLELMISALNEGEPREFRRLCKLGNELFQGPLVKPFRTLHLFLDELAERGLLEEYMRTCYELDLNELFVFAGHLTTQEYAHLLPYAQALTVPTIVPGRPTDLLLKRSMASGVVPITLESSGMDASPAPGQRSSIGPDMIFTLAEACKTALGMSGGLEKLGSGEMRAFIKREYSWDAVAAAFSAFFERPTQG